MRWYKLTCYLLINFVHVENTMHKQRLKHLTFPSKGFVFSIWTQQSQQFTAKSTIGTNWNIFTFNSKNNDMMPLTSFYCLHLNWTDFTPCSSASFANFEQVIVCWERSYHNKDNLSKQDIFFHLILKLPNLCWDTFSRRWNNNGGISTVSTIH